MCTLFWTVDDFPPYYALSIISMSGKQQSWVASKHTFIISFLTSYWSLKNQMMAQHHLPVLVHNYSSALALQDSCLLFVKSCSITTSTISSNPLFVLTLNRLRASSEQRLDWLHLSSPLNFIMNAWPIFSEWAINECTFLWVLESLHTQSLSYFDFSKIYQQGRKQNVKLKQLFS